MDQKRLDSERDSFNGIYSVCLIQLWHRLQPFVASFCDACNACVLCSPGPHQAIRLPQILAPLIYVFTIKRHGLHRSAVTFLYSHRHSWRTAGWSGKRFMTQTLPGSLKLCKHNLFLFFILDSLSSVQPNPRERKLEQPIWCGSRSFLTKVVVLKKNTQ